ncbi:hypothetical protein K493DRAFT_353764 [Basidiobolus meristosporus CBS 931.73]|uniref:ATPase inhibitor, mitochondrial n=1 Tax=Basidiobolus meristosporus CBS 931.73 TaxID=1314790 RepID=A0A1Y1Y4W7_9FUNG|nr:hypothetical protein K493DRAFT_353764 [Basidiobolus meristosporus CBS 931.73]|eukprot:ORX93072.1 hypothetical protein K493DRAFT_353764 [Basidiobolus meristosporus CBS 931.73]
MEGNIQKGGGSFAQRGRANEEAYFHQKEMEKLAALSKQQENHGPPTSSGEKEKTQQDSQPKK